MEINIHLSAIQLLEEKGWDLGEGGRNLSPFYVVPGLRKLYVRYIWCNFIHQSAFWYFRDVSLLSSASARYFYKTWLWLVI